MDCYYLGRPLIPFSRLQLFFLLVALLLLRVAVGGHFFNEGIVKLKSSGFTAKYFLAEAKGPGAGFFRSFLDDPDGVIRLCLKAENPMAVTEAELQSPEISPSFTFMIWSDFADRVKLIYSQQNEEIRNSAKARLVQTKSNFQKYANDRERLKTVENSIRNDEELLRFLTEQPSRIESALEVHKGMLEEFLDTNRAELIAHFGSQHRLIGFVRDGEHREDAARQVSSLREQVDSIKEARQGKLQQWLAEVDTIWNSLETQLNSLAVDSSHEEKTIKLHRPFDQPYSWQKIIDRTVPWFDTMVGTLLIIGLFSRLASLAAAGFLVSIVATQPPWVPGTAPTILYIVELAACVVLFVSAAGRFGGLDYIIGQMKILRRKSRLAANVNTASN